MTPRAPRARVAIALRIGLSALLLGGVAAAVDLGAALRSLVGSSPAPVAAGCALLALQNVVLGLRFERLVRALGRPLPTRLAIELSFAGALGNVALPTAVGGDALRVSLLTARGIALRDSLGAVLLERVFGLAVLALLAACTALLAPLEPARLPAAVAAGLSLVALPLLARADRLAALPERGRALAERTGLPVATRALLAAPGLIGVAALTVASHLLLPAAALLFAIGVGLEPDPLPFAAALLSVVLATALPISIGGWGVREAGAVVLLGAIGIPAEPAVAVSVLLGIGLVAAALPGLACVGRAPRGASRPAAG